jgi:hypothetical protein
MVKHFKFLIAILSLGLCVWAQDRTHSTSSEVSITAAEPTHYYYIPTANVNPPNCLVVSLHEMSYSFPDNLQVQASILDNIGRIVFGAKYGFQDNLSLGVGLANTLAHIGPGHHGIWDKSRLGAYLCYGFVKNPTFEAVVTPHMQLFNGNSLGCDVGGMVTPSPFWSVIWEVGTSIDVNTSKFWFNTDGGIRIHPPSIPFMNFDAGIDVSEFPISDPNPSTTPSIYFDAIFSMVTR